MVSLVILYQLREFIKSDPSSVIYINLSTKIIKKKFIIIIIYIFNLCLHFPNFLLVGIMSQTFDRLQNFRFSEESFISNITELESFLDKAGEADSCNTK